MAIEASSNALEHRYVSFVYGIVILIGVMSIIETNHNHKVVIQYFKQKAFSENKLKGYFLSYYWITKN
jgi:hypothetical protein